MIYKHPGDFCLYQMNYIKIYESLIDRSINRLVDPDVYYEIHHIIPKCIGGTDDENNLTKLTYREHFLAHWLLHLINPENKSLELEFAFKLMAFGKKYWSKNIDIYIPSSKKLEKIKIELIKTFSTNEHKLKISNGRKKKKKPKQLTEDEIREIQLNQFLNKQFDKISSTKIIVTNVKQS